MKLRAKHLVWMTQMVGGGEPLTDPGPNRNGGPVAYKAVVEDPGVEIVIVSDLDVVCSTCIHNGGEGRCVNPKSFPWDEGLDMHDWSLELDGRVLGALGIEAGAVMTARDAWKALSEKVPSFDALVPERAGPNTDRGYRAGLSFMLEILGVQ